MIATIKVTTPDPTTGILQTKDTGFVETHIDELRPEYRVVCYSGLRVGIESLMLMMPISELKLIRKNINKQLRERAAHDIRD